MNAPKPPTSLGTPGPLGPRPAAADCPPPVVLGLERIETLLREVAVIDAVAQGFADYSRGLAVIPPVGELLLPRGECHIKYGTTTDHPHYVVKIASGFEGNDAQGLPGGNGLVTLFDSHTGRPLAVLLDGGHLTDVRTAAAGALCARLLKPEPPSRIGVVGTGTQAHFQVDELRRAWPGVDPRDTAAGTGVEVWGRSADKTQRLVKTLRGEGWAADAAPDLDTLASRCDLIVTTTRAKAPLLGPEHLRPGMHITAVGSDTPHKQELQGALLAAADRVAVDSRAQAALRGEVFRAVAEGHVRLEEAIELGELVDDASLGRTKPDQITVADLTGVAVQDLAVASAVYLGHVADAGEPTQS